jgi:phosphoglycerate dehydrogenase-like enzyme
MDGTRILVLAWLPDGVFGHLAARFPECTWVDAREPAVFEQHLPAAQITYGLPLVARLSDMPLLRWIQLIAAGVPAELCAPARARDVTVTNLAGLYGNSIAEHALALMTVLARNMHRAFVNQARQRWDRTVATGAGDLRGKTLALIGLGNIGLAIARLARACGMRVVGCRRSDAPAPGVDHVYPCARLHALLAEADVVAVAAPLTARTEGMLGPAEFAAMKRGVIYINVSRGSIAREDALVHALQSGHVAAAGLDVFATEPLPPGHPLWALPQVVLTPHYAGEVVNQSDQPVRRFARNLASWLGGRPLEGHVDLERGY